MYKNSLAFLVVCIFTYFFQPSNALAQTINKEAITKAAAGMKLRGIGPAVMGGPTDGFMFVTA